MERAAAARAIVAGILARSPFVAAWRRSRLRPTTGTARAWAVLAAAEAEPALLRRPDAAVGAEPAAGRGGPGDGAGPRTTRPRVRRRSPPACRRCRPTRRGRTRRGRPTSAGGAGSRPEGPGRRRARPDRPGPGRGRRWPGDRAGHRPAPPARADRPAADSRPAGTARPAPEPEPAPTAVPTAWGGLAYLLATADAAGIPDALFADPELGTRPAPWLLFHLARLLVGESADSLDGPGRPGRRRTPVRRRAPGTAARPPAARRARPARRPVGAGHRRADRTPAEDAAAGPGRADRGPRRRGRVRAGLDRDPAAPGRRRRRGPPRRPGPRPRLGALAGRRGGDPL